MSVRLPRDHYVRLDSNDYSVHPSAVGRRVEVIADLERVSVFSPAGWSPNTNAAGPGIRASPTPTIAQPPTCCGPLTELRIGRDRSEPVEQRSLTDYDTVFGLDQPDRVDGAVA